MKKFFHELGLIKEECVEKINDFFGWWGTFVYNHAYWVIAGSLLIAVGCCIGLIPPIPKWVDGAENLYALPRSLARDHGEIHRSLFYDSYARQNFVIVKSTSKTDSNVFTWEFLNIVRQLDKLIRGQVVDPVEGRRIAIQRPVGFQTGDDNDETKPNNDNNYKNETETNRLGGTIVRPGDDRGDASQNVLTFQDICLKVANGRCSVQSVLEMGVFEIGEKLTPPGSPPEIYIFDNLVVSPEVRGFVPAYLIGDIESHQCERDLPKALVNNFVKDEFVKPTSNPLFVRAPTTCVTKASALMMIYDLKDDKEHEEINLRWEKVLIDIIKDNEIFGLASVSINAFRSRDDELRASTSESSDILFVILTFIILITYASSLNFSCDLYRSKSYPALAGAGAALLGLISGLGFTCLVGVAFVPTALICPFLVMGIGVDDMFVIVNAYALAYTVDTARDRVSTALRDSGLSITITTLTNLIAFAVGAFSPYLSIRNFCLFSAAGLFMGYVYCLSFFLAFLSIDAKREESQRVCIFCLPKYSDKDIQRMHHDSNNSSNGPKPSAATSTVRNEISTFSLISYKVRNAAARQSGASDCYDDPYPQISPIGMKCGGAIQSSSSFDTINQKQQQRRRTWLSTIVGPVVRLLYGDKSNANDGSQQPPHYEDQIQHQQIECDVLPHLRSTSPGSSNTNESIYDNVVGLRFEGSLKTPPLDDGPQPQGQLKYSNSGLSVDNRVDPQTLKLARNVFLEEPKGNVGRCWRGFFLNTYGPFLTRPFVKAAVLILFTIFFGVSVYGFVHLEQGLELKALSPDSSYLQKFDSDLENYFQSYDVPVELFFPDRTTAWYDLRVQNALYHLDAELRSRPSTKLIINPLLRMLEDEDLRDRLTSGDKEIFEKTLFNELSRKGGKFKQFEQAFVWQGSHLVGWKFSLLPAFMVRSEDRADWMIDIRSQCKNMLNSNPPLEVYPYTYMMVYYESDLGIMKSVMFNMGVAAVAMLLVAFLLIPQLTAGLLVIVTMALIDIGLFGFMYYWDVKLNMVSMINLVISIGFAVDYSAHMCHTFTHCEGDTRNLRAIETLTLMGSPVFHGAFSTLLGVFMLGLSSSYIFRVFFKMFLLVVVFGLLHGVVLLPVLLSLVGSMSSGSHSKVEKLEIQLARRTGASVFSIQLSDESGNPNENYYNKSQYNNNIPLDTNMTYNNNYDITTIQLQQNQHQQIDSISQRQHMYNNRHMRQQSLSAIGFDGSVYSDGRRYNNTNRYINKYHTGGQYYERHHENSRFSAAQSEAWIQNMRFSDAGSCSDVAPPPPPPLPLQFTRRVDRKGSTSGIGVGGGQSTSVGGVRLHNGRHIVDQHHISNSEIYRQAGRVARDSAEYEGRNIGRSNIHRQSLPSHGRTDSGGERQNVTYSASIGGGNLVRFDGGGGSDTLSEASHQYSETFTRQARMGGVIQNRGSHQAQYPEGQTDQRIGSFRRYNNDVRGDSDSNEAYH